MMRSSVNAFSVGAFAIAQPSTSLQDGNRTWLCRRWKSSRLSLNVRRLSQEIVNALDAGLWRAQRTSGGVPAMPCYAMRTEDNSLEGCCSTIELHPRSPPKPRTQRQDTASLAPGENQDGENQDGTRTCSAVRPCGAGPTPTVGRPVQVHAPRPPWDPAGVASPVRRGVRRPTRGTAHR